METLVIIAVVLFGAYIAAALFIFREVPPSISDTFYMYNTLVPGLGYVFTVFMFAEAFLMLPKMVELGTFERWQFLGFLCPVGIALCGSAPLFKDDKTVKRVHFTGALSAAAFGLLWCFFLDRDSLIISVVTLIAICGATADSTGTAKQCSTFWLEIVGFGTIATVLLINTIL